MEYSGHTPTHVHSHLFGSESGVKEGEGDKKLLQYIKANLKLHLSLRNANL